MNGVCTNVIHMHQKGLKNYGMFLFFVLFFPLSFILANSFFLFFSLLIDSLSLLFFVNNRR